MQSIGAAVLHAAGVVPGSGIVAFIGRTVPQAGCAAPQDDISEGAAGTEPERECMIGLT